MEENTESTKPSVMSVGLKYGLFITLASIAFSTIIIVIGMNPLKSDWKGLISAVITVTLVVLAHKNFKDKGDGFMTYGQGFGISFISILISIFLGGIFMYVYANFIDPNMMEEVWQKTAEDMEAKGQNQETIDIALTWTKKLFWAIYFVFGVFIAAVIGVLVPIFTQKKNPDAIPS